MLYAYFGKVDDSEASKRVITSIDGAFNRFVSSDWFRDGWAKEIIKVVDRSELIAWDTIISQFHGHTSVLDISGGSKTLIMMNARRDFIYNSKCIGDNCWDYLLQLSKYINIQVYISWTPQFLWKDDYEMFSLNTGYIIRDRVAFEEEIVAAARLPMVDVDSIKWLNIKYYS